LRVDGHTDSRPIKSTQFPSNWELSTARAIAVVQYMINKGIDGKHLVAAGFGEFQPLNTDVKDIERNRRIEFKLDQR
jgi:chemotaxis protein MotB